MTETSNVNLAKFTV